MNRVEKISAFCVERKIGSHDTYFYVFSFKKKKWTLEKQIADNDDNNGDNDDSHNDIDWINNCLPEYN